ncbi:hypothetical protein SbBS512_E1099 [Shigella boydii CDC 3083-94]|uniref:Uncharacterized protein n=1 Tax=Shigella boydii serotype 18 (strain CDC 3083-94 / BS512) TaxID=344609 RepID=B2TXK8_SHIB3|nr:hypothetical protein SbBS512_E1099 [Shigella boydii CDC 3083-94]
MDGFCKQSNMRFLRGGRQERHIGDFSDWCRAYSDEKEIFAQ